MTRTFSSLHPLRILLVALVLLAVFTVWLLSVVLPVTLVELRYQYKKTLSDTFHITDLRSLILPQFTVDLSSTSRHRENGITIPSVFIDEPVIYNVDPNTPAVYLAALKHGIAHASGTAFPGTGGLGYYFAHSSSPAFVTRYNAVFYLLDKVSLGDKIFIWHDSVRHGYAVYAKQITSPDDVSFLHRNYPEDSVVLQTCWPPGTSAQRLLLFAKSVPQ
jgi:LPXTG-site transpeptidase (sortase) family protein